MKKTHQRLIVILLTVSFLISSCMTVYAAEERDNTTIYDLTVGGMQSFLCKDSNGNDIIITITELPADARSLKNRSYHIAYESIFAWKAEYNVVIKDNNISSVNSPSYTCYKGNIYNCVLKRNSSKQATMSFIYKYMGLSHSTGVKTKVVNNSLQVAVI